MPGAGPLPACGWLGRQGLIGWGWKLVLGCQSRRLWDRGVGQGLKAKECRPGVGRWCRAKHMLDVADQNHDGRVSLEEVVELVRKEAAMERGRKMWRILFGIALSMVILLIGVNAGLSAAIVRPPSLAGILLGLGWTVEDQAHLS